MKQKLFTLVSLTALLASCSSEEFQFEEQGQNVSPIAEGITFKVSNDATTRGEFKTDAEGKFYTAWNAEIDKIGVIYSGVDMGQTITADAAKWCDPAINANRNSKVDTPVDLGGSANKKIAVYKTTKTGKSGEFTAVDDDNILKFAAQSTPQTKGSFRIFRPVIDGADQTNVNYTCTDDPFVPTMLASVKPFNEQSQSTAKANFDNFFMVADPIDNIWSSDMAVGESLPISFERPFTALAVSTKGYDKDVYGKLKSVTVTMEESNISSSASCTVDIAKKDKDGNWVIDPGTVQKTVKVNLNSSNGLDWSDEYYAYMQALPVDRSDAKIAESYTVSLEFANGTIVVDKETKNNWKANDFISISCDLNAQPYLYFDATSTKTLVVNSALPVLDASGKFDSDNEASKVTNLISKVPLSAKDLATIKSKFIGLKNVTLANQATDLGENLSNLNTTGITTLTLTESTTTPIITNYNGLTTVSCPKATTVPAGAFKGNTVLTSVSIPSVQEIGDNAFEGATGLTTIGCTETDNIIIGTTNVTTNVKTSSLTKVGSFAFASVSDITSIDAPVLTTIGSRAFGTAALASLTTVNLPKYDFADPYNAMALLGGAAVQIADLSSVSELGLSTIAFTNNTVLTTVTLKEGVKIGNSAFNGCEKLATVNNIDKAAEIGENAFNGCKALTKVLVNTEVIGKNSFNGCTELATLTLGANVKTIEEGAFSGCTELSTVNNLANVEVIGKEAFKGTAVTTFDFLQATLGEGAFQDCDDLKGQVRSNVTTLEKNVFNGANTVSTFIFPNVTTIKEGALNGLLAGTGSAYVTITFGSALTAIDAKAFIGTFGGGDGTTAEKAKTATVDYNLILSNKEGVTVKDNDLTYKATDGKYYKITFESIQ